MFRSIRVDKLILLIKKSKKCVQKCSSQLWALWQLSTSLALLNLEGLGSLLYAWLARLVSLSALL